MLRKLAVAAAAAVIASAGLAVDSASAQIIRPPGGGGGGAVHFTPHGFSGGSMMHFTPHGFSGGSMMHFAPRGLGAGGFAAPLSYHPGGFARFGAGRYVFGGGTAWRYASAGRFGATAFGAAHADHHGWYGWQGYRRGYVGWGGPVFWPYAYDDLFDYAFWPYGPYDDLFWSYGYDDLFAGVLLPYAYAGLEGGSAPARTYAAPALQSGAAPSGGAPAAHSASQLCVSAQSLAGGAAIDPIAKAVHPTGDQTAKLDALRNSEADAQKTLAASCAAQLPTTAVGRLDAVQTRLQAMIQAANVVGGPLNDFYASLTDEQKAAFNALGDNKNGAAPNLAQMCGPDNAVPVIALGPINSAVQPDAKQQTLLAALSAAAGKADDAVLASCPKEAPLTPTGRLDAVKARLQAMANAVDTVKQPLQDFYVSLSDEQKARFDALTQPPNAAEQQHVEARP
jgi:hypothetical protein